MTSRLARSTRRLAWAACVVPVFAAACGGHSATSPNGALTGRWIQPGTDTYAVLALVQRGAVVTGTFRMYSPVGPPTEAYAVSGRAELPRVSLTWQEGPYRATFDGVLSADGNTLTQPGQASYQRELAPSR
jgi:hypothetical protein